MQSIKQCRDDGTPLLVRATKKTAEQQKKSYYYSSYHWCPQCGKMYFSDDFKIMNQTNSLFQPNTSSEKVDVEIWTDGACSNNGKPTAKASWAFVSPLRQGSGGQAGFYEEAGLVHGKQTNNMGEGMAILEALKWAVKNGHKRIRISTDSQISIHNVQKNASKVKVNRELFEQIESVVKENNLTVFYEKVSGHADNVNNNRADRLANGLVGIK